MAPQLCRESAEQNGVKLSRFKKQIFPIVYSWINYLTSLRLSFLACEMQIIIVSNSQS